MELLLMLGKVAVALFFLELLLFLQVLAVLPDVHCSSPQAVGSD